MDYTLTGGTLTDIGTLTLTVTPVNDAPVVAITPASYPATEQVALTLSGTGISVSDADAGTAVLHATLSVVSGTLTGSAGSTGVTLAGSGTGSVTLDGTLAQINAFLAGDGGASLSYLISTDAPPASDTLTLTVNDLGDTGGPAQSGSDTATMHNISAVNDGPVNHIPGVQVTPANTAVVMSAATGNGLSITYPDAGSGLLRVALTATSGTLTLGTTAGLATVSGDGTASVLVTGTLAALNTALDGLRFTPAGGYTGTACFVVENQVVAGFAGSTADAFTLLERLEKKLEASPGQLARACVDLAKDWRTDKYLRNLEAMLIVTDGVALFVITGGRAMCWSPNMT